MKGPMTTQTLQDIIGKEPHHWRGDRDGIEEFGPAFMGLQGDDVTLTPQEMQEFEDFLSTIHFPPNPYRGFDNSLPTDLPLPGHLRHRQQGSFPRGTPLPNGNAQKGLALYRPPNTLDGFFACVDLSHATDGHGLRTPAGSATSTISRCRPAPTAKKHHQLISQDGSTNRDDQDPPPAQRLREGRHTTPTQPRQPCRASASSTTAASTPWRTLHLGASVVSSSRPTSRSPIMIAFMLSFSGSDLQQTLHGSSVLEPPGPASLDAHAAVGAQTTIRRRLRHLRRQPSPPCSPT